jgi:DNA-directed RNA polymerase specialized sigma24 family protein
VRIVLRPSDERGIARADSPQQEVTESAAEQQPCDDQEHGGTWQTTELGGQQHSADQERPGDNGFKPSQPDRPPIAASDESPLVGEEPGSTGVEEDEKAVDERLKSGLLELNAGDMEKWVAAFADLIEAYWASLFGAMRGAFRSNMSADDIDEAFSYALTILFKMLRRGTFLRAGSLYGLLRVIMLRYLIGLWRQRKRRRRKTVKLPDSDSVLEDDRNCTIEGQDRDDLLELVNEFAKTLDSAIQKAIVVFEIEYACDHGGDLPGDKEVIEAVEERLGCKCSESAIKSARLRIRERLMQYLGKNGYDGYWSTREKRKREKRESEDSDD